MPKVNLTWGEIEIVCASMRTAIGSVLDQALELDETNKIGIFQMEDKATNIQTVLDIIIKQTKGKK